VNLTYQLKCKRCGGFIYEEEDFYDENDTRIMQLGCYICSHKGYIKYKKWEVFKQRLTEAVIRSASRS
jgi:hypothetical protein